MKRLPCSHLTRYESHAELRAAERTKHSHRCGSCGGWHAFTYGPADFPLSVEQMEQHAEEVYGVHLRPLRRTGPSFAHLEFKGGVSMGDAKARVRAGKIDPEMGLVIRKGDDPKHPTVRVKYQPSASQRWYWKTVLAEVFGNLAVHPSLSDSRRYTVTHVPSGTKLGNYPLTRRQAREAAQKLNTLSDWGADIAQRPNYAAIREHAHHILRSVQAGWESGNADTDVRDAS